MLIVLALVAAVVLGTLLSLIIAVPVGVAVGVLILAAGITAHRAGGAPRRATGLVLLLTVLLGGSYLAVTAISVLEAITTTEGTADAADAGSLESARDKLAQVHAADSFRLELTEAELEAVVQDGIAEDPDLPIRRIELDLRGPATAGGQDVGGQPGGDPAAGDIAFTATFKSGSLTAEGTAAVTARDGGLDLELGQLDFGGVRLPGLAQGAIGSLLGAVTDLNGALSATETTVEAVEVGDDVMVVTGHRAGTPLTGNELLDSIRAQAGTTVAAVEAPPEVLGPGRVDAADAPGDPIVLALGDSLAAAAGVDRQRDGYVSRFHRAVADRDGTAYGLRNLGVSGETTASLLDGGQLARAEEILASSAAAYVTLDIGANDLLGHLLSPDCGDDLRTPACQQRVDTTLETYRTQLSTVLDRLVAASGDARIVLLQIYNPFSLGLGESDQEAESSTMVARLNAIAAEVAGDRGVLVADGFTPMQGTTAATTHMLDSEPDIHPNAAGHDVLATALFRAVGGEV